MLFIKNYCKDESSNKLKIWAQTSEDDVAVTVSLQTGVNGITPLIGSTNQDVFSGIRKSVAYIGKKTDSFEKEESSQSGSSVVADLFGDKVSEVSLYVKNCMISLAEAPNDEMWEGIPIQLSVITTTPSDKDKAESKKRYLRDIIAFVVDKGDTPATVRYDARNIVEKPFVISGDTCDVILIIPKWPSWGNLKFPAYFSIERPVAGTDSVSVIGAVKLGCHTENNSTRNQIIDVDCEEATKYLDETAALMEKRKIEAGVDKLNKKYNGGKSDRSGNGKKNKGKETEKPNNRGVGVPPMYPGKPGKSRPIQGKKNKNYRKSGNR